MVLTFFGGIIGVVSAVRNQPNNYAVRSELFRPQFETWMIALSFDRFNRSRFDLRRFARQKSRKIRPDRMFTISNNFDLFSIVFFYTVVVYISAMETKNKPNIIGRIDKADFPKLNLKEFM